MKIEFFSPSYKRPEKSITQNMYPFVKLVVCESDSKEYIKNGNEVVVVPDKAQGNICRIRNYILDNLFKDNDCIILMDDDCSGIYYYQKQKRIKMKPEVLLEFAEAQAIICNDIGFKYWGLNCVPDKGAYREHTPFGFLQYIGSPFTGHLKDDLRYDEDLPLKEDYDFTLQNIKKHGGCFRVNYAHYNVKQAEQTGGCATYRNLEREKTQFLALQKKWGSGIITQDSSSKRKFDFNPILKLPLKGV